MSSLAVTRFCRDRPLASLRATPDGSTPSAATWLRTHAPVAANVVPAAFVVPTPDRKAAWRARISVRALSESVRARASWSPTGADSTEPRTVGAAPALAAGAGSRAWSTR